MEDLSKLPARVSKVHIEGLEHTKDDVVRKIVRSLFKVKTAEQLFDGITQPKLQLERLDAFKNVDVQIDTSRGPLARPEDYEVTFKVAEKRRLAFGANTMVGTRNDGCLLVHTRTRNTFGRGESTALEWQYSTRDSGGLNLTFAKPLAPWTIASPNLSATAFLTNAALDWSSLSQTDRGFRCEFSWRPSIHLTQQIRLLQIWRQLEAQTVFAPMAVRQHAGHDLKASLQHIASFDTRDNAPLPRKGSLIRLVQELAGLNGNVHFHKHELELQHNVSLADKVSLQGSFTAGLLAGLPKQQQPLSPLDKFYLGGPLNVRGFKLFGIGPKKSDCVLGGNHFWAAGLHLYTPLPADYWLGRFRDSIRTHVFVNAGQLEDCPLRPGLSENLKMLTDRVRTSAGVGLVVSLGNFARIELNYTIPLNSEACDKRDAGLQFGFGINYI